MFKPLRVSKDILSVHVLVGDIAAFYDMDLSRDAPKSPPSLLDDSSDGEELDPKPFDSHLLNGVTDHPEEPKRTLTPDDFALFKKESLEETSGVLRPPPPPVTCGMSSSSTDTSAPTDERTQNLLQRYSTTEVHPNGGASVLHMNWGDIESLDSSQLELLIDGFFRETFKEGSSGTAQHVMSVVHGAARYLPEFVQYLGEVHCSMKVKVGSLTKQAEVTTMTMGEYLKLVESTYAEGTYRCGPLNHISLVGTVNEEVGGYIRDVIYLLQQSPFLSRSLPWGVMSKLERMDPTHSDDGPILWTRPGEQVIPLGEGRDGSGRKRKT